MPYTERQFTEFIPAIKCGCNSQLFAVYTRPFVYSTNGSLKRITVSGQVQRKRQLMEMWFVSLLECCFDLYTLTELHQSGRPLSTRSNKHFICCSFVYQYGQSLPLDKSSRCPSRHGAVCGGNAMLTAPPVRGLSFRRSVESGLSHQSKSSDGEHQWGAPRQTQQT